MSTRMQLPEESEQLVESIPLHLAEIAVDDILPVNKIKDCIQLLESSKNEVLHELRPLFIPSKSERVNKMREYCINEVISILNSLRENSDPSAQDLFNFLIKSNVNPLNPSFQDLMDSLTSYYILSDAPNDRNRSLMTYANLCQTFGSSAYAFQAIGYISDSETRDNARTDVLTMRIKHCATFADTLKKSINGMDIYQNPRLHMLSQEFGSLSGILRQTEPFPYRVINSEGAVIGRKKTDYKRFDQLRFIIYSLKSDPELVNTLYYSSILLCKTPDIFKDNSREVKKLLRYFVHDKDWKNLYYKCDHAIHSY